MPDPEPKKEEGNLPPEVTKVLEDLKVKMENLPQKETPPPATTAPTWQEQRAVLQKRLGYNDEQMAAHEEMILKSQAPVIESTGWSHLEKKPDLVNYRKEIEAELENYPQERRSPQLMEKIYYFVKGKHADSKPAPAPNAPNPKVAGSRVSSGPGYSGTEPGLPAGGVSRDEGGPPQEEALDDREKFMADKLGISEKDYAKSRNAGREIRELRVPDTRQPTSLADIELRRLQNTR